MQFTDSCHVSFLRTITHVNAGCDATQELTNTAILVESDTERRREATATVNVTVPCQTHGQQGCSHGYWKNHLGSWGPTGFASEDKVGEVFKVPAGLDELADDTLLAALKYGGGPGNLGGAKILLRQAAGALLNAAHPNVSFPVLASEVISRVHAALASEDRSTMLALADELDRLNNLGCPLN